MIIKNIVLVIDDVEPGLVRAVSKLSKKLDTKLQIIVLVDVNYPTHRKRASQSNIKEIKCDFNDPNQIQAAVRPFLQTILLVTCKMESSIRAFRKAVPFLPYVNTPSESALKWTTEKSLMRQRIHNYDTSLVPKFLMVDDYSDSVVNNICNNMKFPLIVKPNGLAASILVQQCDNHDELKIVLKKTFDVIHEIYSRDLGRGQPRVIIEEFIEGDMYSIDAYVNSSGMIYFLPIIKVITAHSIGLDGFYSYSFVVPVKINEAEITNAQKVASSAIHALNLSSSSAHIELFHSPQGWKIIELGPRIGGYREDLYREAYGIDHYYNDLLNRLDLPPEISTSPISHADCFNIYAEKEGIINTIEGVDEAVKVPSLISIGVHAKPGDTALFAGNGGRLLVDGILSNIDPVKLSEDVAKIRQLIKIHTS